MHLLENLVTIPTSPGTQANQALPQRQDGTTGSGPMDLEVAFFSLSFPLFLPPRVCLLSLSL